MKKYRCALIGCGRIGSLLEKDKKRPHPCTHAGSYHFHPLTELVCACDIDKKKLSVFSKDWGIATKNLYTDFREMLKRDDIDIISIAADTEFHFEMLEYIIRKSGNIKLIFTEKPVVSDIDEEKKLRKLLKKTQLKIAVNHERRWCSKHNYVKGLIEKKEFGELRTIVGNIMTAPPGKDWHSNINKSGGGPLLHDGTHLIDIMRFFAGDIEYVTGKIGRNYSELKVEDTAYAFLEFKSGVNGFIEAGGRRKYFNFEVDLQFSEGRIIIGNSIFKIFTKDKSPRYEGFTELKEIPLPKLKITNFTLNTVDDLIKTIEQKKYNSKSSIFDGLEAFNTIMGIYYSGVNNQKRIKLPVVLNKHPLK